MTKILYFITDLGIGGAETILYSMLKKLDRNRYCPVVCCLYGGELLNKIKDLNIRVIDLKVKSKFDFLFIFKLYYLLRKEKPYIIHTHLFHANSVGRIIARLASVPVVISTQHHSISFHGKIGIIADRLTANLADKIIAVSEAAKRFCTEIERISVKKIITIYNGIDLTVEEKAKSNLKSQLSLNSKPIIGGIGRFVEVKGYKYLLYAASNIVKFYPNAKFILLGYGPDKFRLAKLANKLNLSNKVLFLDPTIKVKEFLPIIDVYVLPSLTEGLSITLLEAMAISKPVVVTNVGGNPEVVIDNVSGLIVPPRDPDALSKAVITILRDSNFADKIAFNARKTVEEKFSFDNMLKNTESLYHSLLPTNIELLKPRWNLFNRHIAIYGRTQ